MAYTPTNWKTGDTVSSTRLNKLENGVSGIASQVDDVEDEIGDLSELETTAKTDLVSAINEAAQSGGGGTSIDLGITGATVGTYAKVKTVDANGKPTSWETDAGGGGGGGDGDLVVVTVTGTTPSITAAASHRYKCGEVTELSFTPSATGICDVVFTSGTTATILTVPNTVKWPDGFDPTSLEASTTYELNVVDGTLGGVIKWQ